MSRTRLATPFVVALSMIVGACNSSTDDGGGGNPPVEGQILVLNSLSKTVNQFTIDRNQLIPFGAQLPLPSNFDGVTMDILGNLLVTTVSSFNGSQVIWADLGSGDIITTGFPGANGALANPGKPTIVVDTNGMVGALVPARAENSLYISFPGEQNAILISNNAGEFSERALPFGLFVFTADANLDDEGGTFAPLGDAQMSLIRFDTGAVFDQFTLTGSTNVTDAIFSQEQIIVVAGGSFTGPNFDPAGDGNVVVVNAPDRGIRVTRALEGNGVAFEAGRNGLGYIVRTKGSFDETDVLTFNFSTENFERGPVNPIQPIDSDGTNLNCRVVTGLIDSRMVCATFTAAGQGRLVLLDTEGMFLDSAPIGAGATDIFVR